jgi:hypothetical protein
MDALLKYINLQLKNGDEHGLETIFNNQKLFHDFRNWFFRTIKVSWHAF